MAVDGEVRLLDAISRAGGIDPALADIEDAYVVREGRVLPVSITALVRRGALHENVPMRDGDVIFVPRRRDRQVYVFGEVGRPGVLEIAPEGRLTLAQALAASGGLTQDAACDQIRIFRGGWRQPMAYTLSAHEVYRYGTDIWLKPGDRIFVAPSGLATWGRAFGQLMPLIQGPVALALTAEALDDDN
jgi:polysaccharide export outer membrane protein